MDTVSLRGRLVLWLIFINRMVISAVIVVAVKTEKCKSAVKCVGVCAFLQLSHLLMLLCMSDAPCIAATTGLISLDP